MPRPESVEEPGSFQLAWGRRGISDGRFQKPRAAAIDDEDHIYIVDRTARIQVFDTSGNFLRSWSTPTHENGRPSGMSMARDGNLMVADTHYFQILFYTPGGEPIPERTLGGEYGTAGGKFGFVTDVVQDSQGNYFASEYGENDRVQKFSPSGEFLTQWGGHGSQPGQFLRPESLAVDKEDNIWVADACNHRIQIFDSAGKFLRTWGREGDAPGELKYPYDLVLDDEGFVYVCEFGNHRVQKFTLDGVSVRCWGIQGRNVGQLHNPWALVRDSKGHIFVIDTYNHRVQRIVL